MDFDDFALNAPDELLLMEETDPDRFNKLVEDKIKAVRLSGIVEKSETEPAINLNVKVYQPGNNSLKRFDAFMKKQQGNSQLTGNSENQPVTTKNSDLTEFDRLSTQHLQVIQQNDPARFNKLVEQKIDAVLLSNPKLFQA